MGSTQGQFSYLFNLTVVDEPDKFEQAAQERFLHLMQQLQGLDDTGKVSHIQSIASSSTQSHDELQACLLYGIIIQPLNPASDERIQVLAHQMVKNLGHKGCHCCSF